MLVQIAMRIEQESRLSTNSTMALFPLKSGEAGSNSTAKWKLTSPRSSTKTSPQLKEKFNSMCIHFSVVQVPIHELQLFYIIDLLDGDRIYSVQMEVSSLRL